MKAKVATCVRRSVALLLAFAGLPMSAQKVVTVVGGYVPDGVSATSSSLSDPQYAAFDGQGNLYITDGGNSRIRKVDAAGNISTVAGNGICGFTGDGGLASEAEICEPTGLAIDEDGAILFADGEVRVRKIDPTTGNISTVAGNGTGTFCGDGGLAVNACIVPEGGIAVVGTTTTGLLYIADTFNSRIRRVEFKTGIISTIAGDGVRGFGGDGGPAKKAELNSPLGVVAYPKSHALWIADQGNNVIREVNTDSGIITTFFGSGACGDVLQSLCNPTGVAVDKRGNLYIADAGNSRVLQVANGNNAVTLEAGAGSGFNGDGIPANTAFLSNPNSITFDGSGNLLIVDSTNDRIRKGGGSQNISTVAGGYIGDGGAATEAHLDTSLSIGGGGIGFDMAGDLYVGESFGNRVRKVTAGGKISTFAGTGITGYSGDGGPATSAEVVPYGVAASGRSVFVSTAGIQKVSAAGTITNFSGGGFIVGIAADALGNVYAADLILCVVWKVDASGNAIVIAGINDQCGFNGDGIAATQAELSLPMDVAVDSAGNVYIADYFNNRIRMVNTSGIISTVAGNGYCAFGGDGGPATAAMLCEPFGVAVDAHQNFYIADTGNFRVRKVTAAGTITTIAGTGFSPYNGDGLPGVQTNLFPTGVAVNPKGLIYIRDGQRVRKMQ